MTKSELMDKLCSSNDKISARDVESGCRIIIDSMINMLTDKGRIEIRGFGSFSIHERAPRIGRNPKTGDQVALETKYVPHFKPGKQLRDEVNKSTSEIKKEN